jgi:hypothetical protein
MEVRLGVRLIGGAPSCVPSDAIQEMPSGHRLVVELVIAESLRGFLRVFLVD